MKNESNAINEVLQFVWPLECSDQDITSDKCQKSKILYDEHFWLNLHSFTDCNSNETKITINRIPRFECKYAK